MNPKFGEIPVRPAIQWGSLGSRRCRCNRVMNLFNLSLGTALAVAVDCQQRDLFAYGKLRMFFRTPSILLLLFPRHLGFLYMPG